MRTQRILHLLAMLTLVATGASAQSNGAYALSGSTLAGGASTSSSIGFSLAGTIGQFHVGTHMGGRYSLVGGFWATESGTANPATDSDGDGIPDKWEREHGLNPGIGDGIRDDSDGDGASNLQEYVANTNPLDAQSYLRLDIAPISDVGPSPMITWVASPDRVYQIWMRNSLNSAWVDSGFGLIRSTAGVGPSPMRAEFGVGPSPMYRLFGVGPSPLREVFGVGPSPMHLFRLEVELPPAGR